MDKNPRKMLVAVCWGILRPNLLMVTRVAQVGFPPVALLWSDSHPPPKKLDTLRPTALLVIVVLTFPMQPPAALHGDGICLDTDDCSHCTRTSSAELGAT